MPNKAVPSKTEFKTMVGSMCVPWSLVPGHIYYDIVRGQEVEFCYMGPNHAIVCEPGDSGGGMQSTWGLEVKNLLERNVPCDNCAHLLHEHQDGKRCTHLTGALMCQCTLHQNH